MSKRKNRSSSPNIPRQTLERARQQISQPQDEAVEPLETVEAKPAAPEKAAPAVDIGFQPAPPPAAPARTGEAPRPTSSARRVAERRRAREMTVQAKSGGRPGEPMTHEMIVERLEHPTRIVTEAELRQDYSYVLKDLRSMGLLAAGLVVALILIAQFL
jgi:hypothetical protein